MTFNLLPWRTELRVYQLQQLYQLLGITILLNVLLIAIVHQFFIFELDQINLHVNALQARLHDHAAQKLTASPASTMYINDEFKKAIKFDRKIKQFFMGLMPINEMNICLKSIAQHDSEMVLFGFAASQSDLMRYLKNLETNHRFETIKIASIKQLQPDDNAVLFQLIFG